MGLDIVCEYGDVCFVKIYIWIWDICFREFDVGNLCVDCVDGGVDVCFDIG